MTPRRAAVLLLLVFGGLTSPGSPALAQTVNLTEAAKPGDCSRYTVELALAGNLLVTQENGRQPIRLEARARHRFAERTLAVEHHLPAKSARHYEEAAASAVVGGDKFDRTLAADRRLVVAQMSVEGLLCYSPAGPVTRDELDLVTEHFNPQCLPGLLPGREVKVGDVWDLGNPAVQSACLFDGLIANKLAGKLVEVKDGLAVFTVHGTAEGIEHGARVTLSVEATGKFDPAANRVVELIWKQKDEREQGPVNPASQVEATVTLRREVLPGPPAEVGDAALAGVPKDDPSAALTHLRYADPKGRYQFVYPRDWHVTGQTDPHLVLRLIDRGEFVAQATVTVWKKADPGRHTPPEEFKKAVAESPGWVAVRVLEDHEVPADGGRWVYRLASEGRMGELPVVQCFHLLAGPQGDQVVVTLAARPEKLRAVGTRDLDLVRAIEFRK
jgi:hypothetical protein